MWNPSIDFLFITYHAGRLNTYERLQGHLLLTASKIQVPWISVNLILMDNLGYSIIEFLITDRSMSIQKQFSIQGKPAIQHFDQREFCFLNLG